MEAAGTKIVTADTARQRAGELRGEGKRLVTVNGTFDLLHAGHLAILEEAKAQGDALFIGLNSDVSVKQYKGPDRPVIPEAQRAAMLAALACVDVVVLLDEPEAGGAIIALVRPHVHVNGSEYGPPEEWVEYPAMVTYGVRGHSCSRRAGLATTELIRKIRELPHEHAAE